MIEPTILRLIFLAKSGSRGTRADQGVRPTIYAGFLVSGKVCGIGLSSCATGSCSFQIDSAYAVTSGGQGLPRVVVVGEAAATDGHERPEQ
jgi:hypothetical protein